MISRNAIEWYFQRVTGGLLLILLAAHFWVEHFMTASVLRGDLTFETVASRVSHPAWQAIDIAFLIVALAHGLNGLRNIILDYGRLGPMWTGTMNTALVVVGVIWAWWGILAFSRL
jgi:succinate dehydrogenase / fumarate reductase, membrane anchor subunit